jgi:cyclic pyranopterin phosphate synthase
MTSTSRISLAVLCGGRSARLGSDKGLHQPLGDEALVARAVRLWGELAQDVMIVVRDEDQANLYKSRLERLLTDPEFASVRIVTDEASDTHAALNGVATALRSARHEAVLTIPVDQLGVRTLHLRKLTGALAASAQPVAATSFRSEAGDVLPFPSLWTKELAKERVESLIAAGSFSVKAALAESRTLFVDAGEYAEELAFNGNTADEIKSYFGEPLFDPYDRRLHYLRFSLTEACNLSCTYCLPEGFPEWYRHKARLGAREIDVLLRGFRKLGFRKLRLTGGEPTVHPKCLDALKLARRVGFERIAMTTNGLLMPDLTPWVDAGLNQLNVSLDSLDPEKFHAVTGSREAAKVQKVIEDAAALGLTVKVNTVLLRSKNGDRENIEQLIDWALDLPITLRFIELMETKLNGSFAAPERVLGTEIEPYLTARGLIQEAWDQRAPDLRGPATDYSAPGKPGRIGLINPMSCNFCSKCNRLRVTAKAGLKLCLFGDADLPLDLASPESVALNVRRLIGRKPERHHLEAGDVGNVSTFRTIGG